MFGADGCTCDNDNKWAFQWTRTIELVMCEKIKKVSFFDRLRSHNRRKFTEKAEKLNKVEEVKKQQQKFWGLTKQTPSPKHRHKVTGERDIAKEKENQFSVIPLQVPIDGTKVLKRQSCKDLGSFLKCVSSLHFFHLVLLQLRTLPFNVNNNQEKEASKTDFCCSTSLCSVCRSICNDEEDDGPEGALIQLTDCKHYAHISFLHQQLRSRWTGSNISFGYLNCGECRAPLRHDTLALQLIPHQLLKQQVECLCRQQAQEIKLFDRAELENNAVVTTALCMEALSFYLCSKCTEPFCAGRVECAQNDELDLRNLMCASCVFDCQDAKQIATGWRGKCQTHGYRFAVYKCDSCCSVATFDCRSNHYCERCHNKATDEKTFKCLGPGKCPLGIEHPPNGAGVHGTVDVGFVIGCSKCFLGAEKELEDFELATDSSSRGAVNNWKERF